MGATDTSISRRLAIRLVQVEKFVLPIVYAKLAWQQFQFLRSQQTAHIILKAAGLVSNTMESIYTVGFIRHLLLLILIVFTGGSLLLNRTPVVLPDKLKHLLVPLAMSFYLILYGIVDDLPLGLRQNLIPWRWQLPLSIGGVALSAVGYGVSIWAILYLRRSFALMVSVRKVVLGGPYAYIRHPIYTGYLLDSIGLLMVTCSIAMLVLVAGFIGVMICRAKLEEVKLSEFSAAYREHRHQVGFLFPRAGSGHRNPLKIPTNK